MNRRMTIAGLAVVVIAVAALMAWLGDGGPTALAQQAQPPTARAQPPATQPAQPAPDLKALAAAADEWVKNNPPGKTQAAEKPQAKDNAFPKVSPEEREAMGLPAPTWVAKHGKIQPAVREALEAQRKLIESKDPMRGFQFDRPVGFQGTAYVDVYLRHEAKGKPDSKENSDAVREAQDRLLRDLTAAEFSAIFVFKGNASVIGYINDAGLAKLAEDTSVVAIGLDDQARPVNPPQAKHKDDKGPAERVGKIEAAVYKALETSEGGYVFVTVSLNRPLDWPIPEEQKEAIMKEMQDRVLSVLTAGEFRLVSRSSTGGFYGYITAAALAKLDRHPDVWGVGLTEVVRTSN